jgi:predicted TIM-barrel fold metal-dependent hydrolase
MARKYEIISADSHLDLSPERWKHHVPARWRDEAPRQVRLDDGTDAIVVGDSAPLRIGFTRSVGLPRSELHLQVPTFETAGGTGGPERRLSEQDQDGIDAEVMFSRVRGFIRRVKDDAGYLALNRAYNEYLAEEYAAAAPDRLIPMGVIPTTGVDDAVSEMEYCKKVGFKGVLLDKFPSGKGYPTPEDDRFWAASIDLQMPLTHHTGGGTSRMTARDEPTFNYAKGVGGDEDEGEGGLFRGDPMRHWLFRFCGDAACAPIQMAFEGVWDRFPTLRVYWAETMIGWLKYALWQMDDHYERYKYLANGLYGLDWLERLPSDYIKAHCVWGFLSDPVGVQDRAAAGTQNVMWGSDFAHAASDWPNSKRVIENNFAGVPEDEKRMMVAGNAIRYFHLDAA